MYFKRLEMRGFKSFVEETKLDFEPGITAIVGPNGCGKSNVADAIRWVLGEQSAKVMRGTKMEDFIFTGSQNRKRAGFAQVSITISNDGEITSAPFAEYDEITVTRKLYRTGESEYFINKVPCRLKDVVDIFLDTGISARSFSIIEHAQIAQIVNSKPDERRGLIEEAAGVMKYKYRRNAALNKLALSQQNLLRIQDILGELERQRNSLNRQAKKAERFRAFRTEIKERALEYYADEYQRLKSDLTRDEQALNIARENETIGSARLASLRNNSESLLADQQRIEREAGALREKKHTILSTIERNENHKNLLERQIEDITTASINAATELSAMEEEKSTLAKRIDERRVEEESLGNSIKQKTAVKNRLREETDQNRIYLQKLQNEKAEEANESINLIRQISSLDNELSSINAKLEGANSRIAGLVTKENELGRAAEELLEREEKSELGKGELAKSKESAGLRKESLLIKRSETKNDLTAFEAELKISEQEATRIISRIDSLEELDRNMEGYGEGVKKLVTLHNEGKLANLTLGNMVAGEMEINEAHETAIAAVLGDRLTAVIVESESACREAITFLKNEKGGRATLLALDLSYAKLPEYDLPESISADISFIGKAVDLVSVTDVQHTKNIKRLLSGVLVINDLPSAVSMAKTCEAPFRFVTLRGDVVEPDGTVSGGSAISGGGASIVARKRIVSELAKQGEEVTQKINTLKEKIGVISGAIEQIDLELEICVNEQKNIDMDLFAVTKEIEQISIEITSTNNASRSAKNEITQIGEENRSLTRRKEEIDQIKQTSLVRGSQIEELMANLETQIQKTSDNLASSSATLSEEEITVTQLKGNLENINADLSRLVSSLADLTKRKDRLFVSQVDSSRRKNEITQSIDDLLRENVDLARGKDEIDVKIVRRTESLAQTIERREEIETEIKSLEVELAALRELISELSMNRSELAVRLENCLEKSDTEFNIPEEDLDVFDAENVDIAAAKQRLRFLRSELSRIGAVNMSALDEFDEVNERFEHMKNQHDDLVKSVANLRKTIDSINGTTRKLFDEAFKEIAANFEVVFVKLFGGGRAEMRLVQDDEENLEPGVEILVQPPGKKVSHLNLLSAGEKAMTAISLLFAIFLRQPSPFCLLDEVDAPLDEANIFRFRDILDTLKERTQFIVITHSQKTMSFADRLYGVTQEEQGVSKILGVDLHDHRHDDYTVTAA